MALATNAVAKEIANDLIEISGRHADGGVGSTCDGFVRLKFWLFF